MAFAACGQGRGIEIAAPGADAVAAHRAVRTDRVGKSDISVAENTFAQCHVVRKLQIDGVKPGFAVLFFHPEIADGSQARTTTKKSIRSTHVVGLAQGDGSDPHGTVTPEQCPRQSKQQNGHKVRTEPKQNVLFGGKARGADKIEPIDCEIEQQQEQCRNDAAYSPTACDAVQVGIAVFEFGDGTLSGGGFAVCAV